MKKTKLLRRFLFCSSLLCLFAGCSTASLQDSKRAPSSIDETSILPGRYPEQKDLEALATGWGKACEGRASVEDCPIEDKIQAVINSENDLREKLKQIVISKNQKIYIQVNACDFGPRGALRGADFEVPIFQCSTTAWSRPSPQ